MRHKILLKEVIKHLKYDKDFRDCLKDYLFSGEGERYIKDELEMFREGIRHEH